MTLHLASASSLWRILSIGGVFGNNRVSLQLLNNLARQTLRWFSIVLSIPFEVMNSGSWHNHFPGETRVQLDLSGLVSFYDTQLVPSLVAVRAGQERWDHRVQDISSEDLSAVKSRLEATLMRPSGQSSGVDWRTLAQVIVDRFSGRLELTRYLLDSSVADSNELLDLANKTQTQLRTMLTPYILVSSTPTDPLDKTDLDWAIPVFKFCATIHTSSLEFELDSMTGSEKLLLQAVRGTSREICRVVTKMWAAGVYAGIDPSLNTKESFDIAEVTHVWRTWAEDLDHLMTWLDWNVWIKCDPACGPEVRHSVVTRTSYSDTTYRQEMCYLPTWPAGFPRGRRPGGPPPPPDHDGPPPERPPHFDLRSAVMESFAEEMRHAVEPDPDDWVRPQPRCIRRVAPYDS